MTEKTDEEKKVQKGEVYRCVRCNSLVAKEQLDLMLEVKCHNCGYRVLRKIRPPIVRKIQAR